MPSNARGMTYEQPNLYLSQPPQQLSVPRPNQAQHSGDVRAQVLNVLTTTANSCLVEQGFDPKLARRIEDLEFERLRIFEDNKNLKMMLDNERSKNQHLSKPHNELISVVVNSQNDLKRVSTENAALRTENSAIAAKLKSLERERGVQNNNNIAHQRLQASYNDLAGAYQNAMAKLANTEQQLNALAVHCRKCPEYARQIQAFRAQSGTQLQLVSPNQLHQFLSQQQQPQQGPSSQPHEQQRRASAPDTNVGSRPSSQPRFPAMPTPVVAARMGPPSQAVPRPSHGRSGSATNLRAATSSAPGPTSFPVPSPTMSGPQINGPSSSSAPPSFIVVPANMNSSSMPINSQPRILQQPIPAPLPPQTLANGPQNSNAPNQVPHNAPPQMQRAHQFVPTHSQPSSTLGHALDPNFNAQTQRSASHPPSQTAASAPNVVPTQQPTPIAGSAISAPSMASLHPVGNSSDPWFMVADHLFATPKRPPSVISVTSTSRASSVASVTRPQTQQQQQQPQNASNVPATTMPASSAPPPALNSQSLSSDAQLAAVLSVPPPSLSSTSSDLTRSAPGELTGQSSAPSNPPSGITRVAEKSTDMNVDATATRMAMKRSSVVLGEPLTLPEGKKMRLSGEGASASASPAPMQIIDDENGGGVAAATAPEKRQQEGLEDDDEDEEDIAVGPDGLRLISDCLASLFETNEAGGRTCRLCKTRHTRGLISDAPAPFVNAPDEMLVQHCTSEHEQVWNELRHDV